MLDRIRSFIDGGRAAQLAVDQLDAGRKAYHDGLTIDQCPHPADSHEAHRWRIGWKLALESCEGE